MLRLFFLPSARIRGSVELLSAATQNQIALFSQALHNKFEENEHMDIEEKSSRANFPIAFELSSRASGAILIGALVFGALTPLPANAEPTPSPSPASSLSPNEQFKVDYNLYLVKLRNREIAMRNLNQSYRLAIEKARRDYQFSLRSAKGPTEKSLLSAKFDEVKSSATAALELAREKLGPAPVPPTEPAKSGRSKANQEFQKNRNR